MKILLFMFMFMFFSSSAFSSLYCEATFPDGLGSHQKNSTITFGRNAQLLNNPNINLSASNISQNPGSSVASCDSADCTNKQDLINAVSVGRIKTTASSTQENVGLLSSGEIGNTENEYQEVNLSLASELNVAVGNYNEFIIDKFDIGGLSTVNLAPGIYWINDFSIGFGSTINVLDGGPVRLYINNVDSWSDSSLINSPSFNNAGDSKDLLIYFKSSVRIGSGSTLSAAVYSEADVTLNPNSALFGLLSAQNIQLRTNSYVSYQASAYDGLSDISWCEGSSVAIGYISIVSPSTGINCLPQPVEIKIYDVNNNLITDYEKTINLSTDVNHGDWSKSTLANGVLSQSQVDSGKSDYNMLASDGGGVDFYLKNTHPESTIITVESEGVSAVVSVNFSKAGFVFKNNNNIEKDNNINNKIATVKKTFSPVTIRKL